MMKLGISIYPTIESKERDMAYISKAAALGFKSIFTCFLSVEKGKEEETIHLFEEINTYAKKLGMEITFDVAPSVFDRFAISHNDLAFFQKLGGYAIRLDEGFDIQKEVSMSYNSQGLKLVINASNCTNYIDVLAKYGGNMEAIEACHNFYPQKYTGISFNHFQDCNKAILSYSIPIGAFISSQNDFTFGPWPVYEGLCTLEQHRKLPLNLQARHLAATKQISQIIVANAYASDDELNLLASIDYTKLTLGIHIENNTTPLEKEIIFQYPHIVRGDKSEYMARSTQCRETYKNQDIPPHDTRNLKCGDIVILNNLYGRYKGELHVVLKDMENDGNKNIVGKLAENEFILLEYLKPWTPFKLFMEGKNYEI